MIITINSSCKLPGYMALFIFKMAASDRCRSYFKRRKRTAEEELQGLTEQLTEQCVNLSTKIKKADPTSSFIAIPELGSLLRSRY